MAARLAIPACCAVQVAVYSATDHRDVGNGYYATRVIPEGTLWVGEKASVAFDRLQFEAGYHIWLDGGARAYSLTGQDACFYLFNSPDEHPDDQVEFPLWAHANAKFEEVEVEGELRIAVRTVEIIQVGVQVLVTPYMVDVPRRSSRLRLR